MNRLRQRNATIFSTSNAQKRLTENEKEQKNKLSNNNSSILERQVSENIDDEDKKTSLSKNVTKEDLGVTLPITVKTATTIDENMVERSRKKSLLSPNIVLGEGNEDEED